MVFDMEALRNQIPYYLTEEPTQKAFLKELKSLSSGVSRGYYISKNFDPYKKEVLQGDGWRGFQILSFNTGNRSFAKGIVLSNSCDVSAENQRTFPPNITFAPIVKLSQLQKRFQERGLRDSQIDSQLHAIRTQSITNIFYLPADGVLDEEYVVLLDDLHSMPVEAFRKAAEKLFTLSMAGFYLFVFKLSIHFCRLHENVGRTPQTTSPI